KLEAEIAQVQNNPLFLRAFEWRFEFPEVLDNEGNFIGFDVIIGNPPYISNKEIKPLQKEFFQTYQTAKLQYDLFSLFIEKSVILLRQNGIGSYIIPDSFLARSTFKTIREYLYHNTTLYKLLQIDNVFDEAAVSSCVIFFTKSLLNNPKPIEYLKTKNAKTFEAHEIETKQINYLTHEKINSYRLLFIDEHELKLLIKLFQNIPFETHIHIWRGEEIGKKSSLISENQFDSTMLPIITGENIERYYFKGKIKFISQSSILKDTIQYNKPKIFIRQLGTSIHAHLAEGNIITTQSVYCLYSVNQKYSNEIILAILNSKLTHFIYKCVFAEKQQFPRILIENIRNLVLPQPNEKIFKQIKVLVDKILSLKRQDQQADTSGLEAEIDRLVYALYDLTETEIKIIERA
ncbi:MAG: Eco57I restriction-modification methylase domain-containing protein, partial [Microscillaceae bacterium]|nr:Eco57I restriction-modification methylase domain-containing protein [Microscillaceae bacterium]MDW8460261.1 Eco57I restriction-modification methylase domain-containing protein [Cytophagales bacterium]